MKTIVTDSSVIVKWFNQHNEPHLGQADQLLQDVQAGKVNLIAPELAKYEVGNALLKKGLTSSQAYQSLGTVYSLPIQFITETDNLASQTYQMASQAQAAGHLKVTYYDASFTALAKQENAVLITDNPKHQALISGVKVIPLKDY